MTLKLKSKVAEFREKAGLTQIQLAVLVGVTPNTIQNWEKDSGLGQLERYLKLAEIFGCNVEELIEYIPTAEGEKTNSKGFSLKELQELRERWGTAAKPESATERKSANKP